MSPNRSRDELLGEVVRRGERLRRRRRVVGGLGGSIALLLAVAGVAAMAGSGDDRATNLAAGGPTTTAAVFGPATGGTVFAVDAPTTTAGPAATTVTTVRTATTVAAVGQVPVAETTTTVPPTTAPPASSPQCTAAQVEVTLVLSKSTYTAGEPITGTTTARNRTAAPCYYFSYSQSQEFRDAAGTPVSPGGAIIADAFTSTPLAPGQTLTGTLSWDQNICYPDPCHPAPSGTYSAVASWSFDSPQIPATATFQIVP